MNKQEVISKLRRMVEKAWCSYTFDQAYSLWKKVATGYPLPYELARPVSVELYHAENEGTQGKLALKDAVDRLIDGL